MKRTWRLALCDKFGYYPATPEDPSTLEMPEPWENQQNQQLSGANWSLEDKLCELQKEYPN